MQKKAKLLLMNPWALTAVCLLCSLFLLLGGRWRSSSSAAQVQVPMFYDAHYLFPRPWTQAQSAPGIPAPFPLAIYGPNSLTQPFVSGADGLEMVEIWLAGPLHTAVELTLWQADGSAYQGQLQIDQPNGRFYRLAFPRIQPAQGQTFQLTITAVTASAEQPVITHAVGGDRLGGPLRVNEYPHAANLQLRTYVAGTAVADALAEQLLPDLFRLRLQQYKALKGEWVAGLMLGMTLLTALFVWLAWPGRQRPSTVLAWLSGASLALFLVWQLADGRVQLGTADAQLTACACQRPSLVGQDARLVHSFLPVLWASRRQPEERFIATRVQDGRGQLLTPAEASVGFAVTVPPNGRLRSRAALEGEGQARFSMWFNEQLLAEQTVTVGDPPFIFDVDLAAYAGQSGELRLMSQPLSGQGTAVWQQPELLAPRPWLLADLPPTAVAAGHQLGDDVRLLAYELQSQADGRVAVTLYWQAARPVAAQATVFVHLLDQSGQLIGQNDAMPVQNSYPLPMWPANTIVVDTHLLAPTSQPVALAVGLYDPVGYGRWSVTNPDGTADPDGRVWLPLADEP